MVFYKNLSELTLEVVTLVPVREIEGKVTKGKEKQAENIIIIFHLFSQYSRTDFVLPKVMVAFVVYENEAISRTCVKIILSIFSCC